MSLRLCGREGTEQHADFVLHSVPTNVTIFRGVPHGFRRFGDKLAASQAWDDTIANGIKWVLSNPSAQKLHIKTD